MKIFPAVVFLSLVLTACAGQQPLPRAQPQNTGPLSLEPVPVTDSLTARAPTPPLPVQNPPVQNPPVQDPAELTNWPAPQVQSLLGTPDLIIKDGPAQAMLYRSDICVLDVSLLETAPTDHFRVTHISARTPVGAPYDTTDCLNRHLSFFSGAHAQ